MSVSRRPVRWPLVAVVAVCTGLAMVPMLWLYHLPYIGDGATSGQLVFGFVFGLAFGAVVAILRPDIFTRSGSGDGVD